MAPMRRTDDFHMLDLASKAHCVEKAVGSYVMVGTGSALVDNYFPRSDRLPLGELNGREADTTPMTAHLCQMELKEGSQLEMG